MHRMFGFSPRLCAACALAAAAFWPPAHSVGGPHVQPISEATILNSPRSDVLPRTDSANDGRLLLLPHSRILAVWPNQHSDDDPNRWVLWTRTFDTALEPLTESSKLLELPLNGQDDSGISATELALLSDETVAAIFSDNSGRDGEGQGVYGWRFTTSGQGLGTFYRINTTGAGSQGQARLALTGDDSIVLWQSEVQDVEQVVRFQRFVQGTAVGGERRATLSDTQISYSGDVAASGGRFYLAWKDFVVDTGSGALTTKISIARLDGDPAAANPFDATATVSAASSPFKCCTTVAALPNDMLLVAWQETPLDRSSGVIKTRVVPSSLGMDAAPLETRFSATTPLVFRMRVAVSPSGASAVLVWDERLPGNRVRAVAGLVDAAGKPVGTSFPLSTDPAFDTSGPQALYTSETEVVITWTELERAPTGPPTRIRGQRFRIGSLVPLCGDGNDDGFLGVFDALSILQAAVGVSICEDCLCDVDGSGRTTAIDALHVLRASVGQPFDPRCPACA